MLHPTLSPTRAFSGIADPNRGYGFRAHRGARHRAALRADRRPRSLTGFIITIKTHSQLLSTSTGFVVQKWRLIGMADVQAERPPSCENCGCATVKVGKLSRLGSRPLIKVYKCQPCRQIISITTAPFISDLRFRPEDVRSRE